MRQIAIRLRTMRNAVTACAANYYYGLSQGSPGIVMRG